MREGSWMRSWGAGLLLVLLFSACALPETGEDTSRKQQGKSSKANNAGEKDFDNRLAQACSAISTDKLASQDDRAAYLDHIANKYEDVGLGFGPLARLAARAIRSNQHEKGAEYFTRLDEICSRT